MLVKWFDRCEQQLAVGVAGHGAEPFASHISVWHWLAVELLELGFVVKEIYVGRRAVLEQVDDPLRFWRDLWASGQSASGGRGGLQSAAAEQSGEGGQAQSGAGAPQQLPAGQSQSLFERWIHGRFIPWSGLHQD